MAEPQLRPRARQIVAQARELLEQQGAEALTMRALAARLGIRAPSLYKHFPDKSAMEAVLIAEGMAELSDALTAAVESAHGPAALLALAESYRTYALEHPALYRLMTDRPLPRDLLPEGLEERAGAAVLQVTGGDHHLARAAWAFAHGMVMLELNGRFPDGADLAATWRSGVLALLNQP